MDDPRLPRLLYTFLVLAALLMLGYYYPQMPQRMASHFAADGSPNGWMTRDAFYLVTCVMCASSAIIAFFAPWQIASKSDARINLPNKEYWLAPERRDSTMRYISSTMSWFGCGLLFVLFAGSVLALRANLAGNHSFNSGAMLIVLGAFLVFLLLLIANMIRHFQAPPEA